MLPVSETLLAAVRQSHAIVSRVRIIEPGQTGVDFPGRDLNIVEGTVTLDATADIRGEVQVTVKEPWPTSSGVDDIAPYGTELLVSRGVILGNGGVERVPLGIYRIVNVEQADAPAGALLITAQDRMSAVIEAELEQPIPFDSTATFADIFDALITDPTTGVLPDVTIEYSDGDGKETEAIGRFLVAEQDRYGFLADRVKDMGKIFYFDYRGVLIVKNSPVSTDIVTTVNAGSDGVLVSLGRSISREGSFNSVVATMEGVDNLPPLVSTARDLDPLSPTYYFGDFGKRPFFYTVQALVTQAELDAIAQALLDSGRGIPYVVDFSMVPNPALEPLDPVEVVYPLDLTTQPHTKRETHVLEQLQIGLGADATMACATKLVFTTL
jgi:hypothetical protein